MSSPTRFRPSPVGGVLEAQADAGSEAARAAGWAAGWAAGSRAAAEAAAGQRRTLDEVERVAELARGARAQAALVVLRRAAEAISAQVVPVVTEVTDLLDDGVVALAEAVLGRELAGSDDGARLALARALSLPAEVGVHTVRLHPLDLTVLLEAGVLADLPVGVELVADRTLSPGDAVAQFPDGFLDARISAAVARARRALEELR
ncbi:FliH/SctL family protein [Pengzhenrongella frigida]|uniref:Flagellar assembly protein FliH n=1 Tax=Pengzhenrongella frigida TaxID=1259133 RepID=A0A4Q5N1X0_9MICO|nr:FliH/SctL family protein [Cellulomonas sp. HLT2-17]RYV50021.1 flagellar assembly protein FliH [Cellulomonas sp. HLT2-17]